MSKIIIMSIRFFWEFPRDSRTPVPPRWCYLVLSMLWMFTAAWYMATSLVHVYASLLFSSISFIFGLLQVIFLAIPGFAIFWEYTELCEFREETKKLAREKYIPK